MSLLNWEHRYRVMRLHTAGHTLDYTISEVYEHVLNTLGAPLKNELNRVEDI